MNIQPVRTEDQYNHALGEIERLMNAVPATPDGDRLDILTTLVEEYERKNYPMDLPDAVAAIEYEMERSGLSVHDLATVIGRPNRVYEILNGKRQLSLRMIRGLHEEFGIPAESLLRHGPSE